jgi:hypothetical protein
VIQSRRLPLVRQKVSGFLVESSTISLYFCGVMTAFFAIAAGTSITVSSIIINSPDAAAVGT